MILRVLCCMVDSEHLHVIYVEVHFIPCPSFYHFEHIAMKL